jgi:gamma-D-glutamyl-L-lysine dipeptidyl-peptidase
MKVSIGKLYPTHVLISVFFICLAIWLACNQPVGESKSVVLKEIGQAYCPDARVCIFDIQLKPKGRKMELSGRTDLPEAIEKLEDTLAKMGFDVSSDKVHTYPDTTLQSFTHALPLSSILNLRSEPKFSSELATQALMGWPILLKYREGDWFRVQTGDGYLSWANEAGLQLLTENALNEYRQQAFAAITGEKTFAYSSPEGAILQDLHPGCIIPLTGIVIDDWVEVRLPNGLSGWVQSGEIVQVNTLLTRVLTVESMLSTAKQYIGRPYLWGGTSPVAMDCSGYTKMVMHMHGYQFPRDASQQISLGREITDDPDLPGVRAGDFLYFGVKAGEDTPEKVTHVAICLGDSRFIHASGQVKIESLNPADSGFAPKRRETFLKAKRINPEELTRLSI